MPIGAILPIAIGAIGSALGAINRNKANQAQQTSTREGQSLQEGLLTGRQHKVNKWLEKLLLEQLRMGPEPSPAEKSLAYNDINRTYDAANARMKNAAIASGFEGSGKEGLGTQAMEIARSNARQNALAQLMNNRQQQLQGWAQLAGGYIRPYSFQNTFKETGTGQTIGGQQNPWLAALGGGLGGVSNLLEQQQIGGWLQGLLGSGNPYDVSPGDLNDLQGGGY